MGEDEEAPTPTMQNNWVEEGKEPQYDEEALKKQYEAMYGRYEDESSCCGSLLRLLLLMVIAALA